MNQNQEQALKSSVSYLIGTPQRPNYVLGASSRRRGIIGLEIHPSKFYSGCKSCGGGKGNNT